jgi:hypothetical protein
MNGHHFFDARTGSAHAWMDGMRRQQKEGKTKGGGEQKGREKNPKTNYLKTNTIKTKTSFQTSHHPWNPPSP